MSAPLAIDVELSAAVVGDELRVRVELRAHGRDPLFVACCQANPFSTPRWSRRPWLARSALDPRCLVLAWARSPALTGVSSSPVGASLALTPGQAQVLEHRERAPLTTHMPVGAPGQRRVEFERVELVVELERRPPGLWSRLTTELRELEPGMFATQGLELEHRVLQTELERSLVLELGDPPWALRVGAGRLQGEVIEAAPH